MLQEMINLQAKLQSETYGKDISKLDTCEKIEAYRINMMALQDELHEALNEMSWKPWAKAEYFNDDRVQQELVDAWHFFMNLMIISGMDAEKLHLRYLAKRKVNIKRQEDGYDGFSTKDENGNATDEPTLDFEELRNEIK